MEFSAKGNKVAEIKIKPLKLSQMICTGQEKRCFEGILGISMALC